MANRNHALHLSSLYYDAVEGSYETWANGNTKTVSAVACKSTSFIQIMWLDEHVGTYSIACSNGSFVITNTDALTNVRFKYRIF